MIFSLIRVIKRRIRKGFCKHHAEYDDEFCHWFCSKCGYQLFYEDLPPKVWKHLERVERKVKRRLF